jgi:hypothetical protein
MRLERSLSYCWGVKDWLALPSSSMPPVSRYRLSQISPLSSGHCLDHQGEKRRLTAGTKMSEVPEIWITWVQITEGLLYFIFIVQIKVGISDCAGDPPDQTNIH